MSTTTIYRQFRNSDEINGYFVVTSFDGIVDAASGTWCASLKAAQAVAATRTTARVAVKDTAPWC